MTTTPTEPRYRVLTAAASVLMNGAHRITLAEVRALPWAPLDDLDVLALLDDPGDCHQLPAVVGITAGGDLARARVALDLATAVGSAFPLVALDDEPTPATPPTPGEVLEVRQRACALVEAYLRSDRDGLTVLVGGTGTEAAQLAIETAWAAASIAAGTAQATGGQVQAIMASVRAAAQREHDEATR